VNVAWPGCDSDDGESGDEEEQEEEGDPKVGDFLTEDMIKRVSKMGYPVTNEGIEKFQWMINEQDKRDQDRHNMYIYNDFSGYGSTEMIENMVSSPSICCSASLTRNTKAGRFQQNSLQERCLAVQEVGLRRGPCNIPQVS